MTDVLQQDLVTYDPLSDVTRRERRSLLGVSMLGLALIWIPLIPMKLAVFGIEFAEVNRKAFVLLYALLVLYYLVAFVIYAMTDFVAWRRNEVIRFHAHERAMQQVKRLNPSQATYSGFASWNSAVIASRIRASFEFGLPIVFALISLFVLVSYRPV